LPETDDCKRKLLGDAARETLQELLQEIIRPQAAC